MLFPKEKAQAIRLVIFDVDGVLTNGLLHYLNEEIEYKAFHMHDGLGIRLLQRAGIKTAIISAKNSQGVKRRLEELEIDEIYLGHEKKLPIYEQLKQKMQLEDKHIAYMGDDLPDLPLLRRAGLALTVRNASQIIKDQAHYITQKKPGKGAVREVCDSLLEAQGLYQSALKVYLE